MATTPQVLRVHKSFARCARESEFFNRFYACLMERSTEIRRHFEGVSSRKQSLFIRTGLPTLILAATGSQVAERRVQQLAQTHRRDGLGVDPKLYDIWLATLLDVVAEFDEEFNDELADAWRKTLRTGLDSFVEAYEASVGEPEPQA